MIMKNAGTKICTNVDLLVRTATLQDGSADRFRRMRTDKVVRTSSSSKEGAAAGQPIWSTTSWNVYSSLEGTLSS